MTNKSLTLESVLEDMSVWRASRSKRGPIPEDLRSKIASLTNCYTAKKITETLGINTGQLKLFQRSFSQENKAKQVTFVRSQQLISKQAVSCCFKRADGTILECDIDSTQLKTVIEGFLC